MKEYFKVGVIRVITIEDPEKLSLHGRIVEKAYPQIKTVNKCIKNQPRGIYDEVSEKEAIPKILSLAEEMVKEDGVDGILISCAGDPGLEEVRKRVKVPVVGAGSATAAVALTVSDKVGVLGITDEAPKPYLKVLGSHMVEYARPYGVKTTLDISKDLNAVISAAEHLKSLGAEVIALACTGYSTLGLAPIIQERAGLPTIDPLIASASVMYFELIRTYKFKDMLG